MPEKFNGTVSWKNQMENKLLKYFFGYICEKTARKVLKLSNSHLIFDQQKNVWLFFLL